MHFSLHIPPGWAQDLGSYKLTNLPGYQFGEELKIITVALNIPTNIMPVTKAYKTKTYIMSSIPCILKGIILSYDRCLKVEDEENF